MDNTTRRLMEIAGHLEAITEVMSDNERGLIASVLLRLYAAEIKNLTEEMKGLLASGSLVS